MEDRNLTLEELANWNKEARPRLAKELFDDDSGDYGIRAVSHQVLVKLHTKLNSDTGLILSESAEKSYFYTTYSGQVIDMGSECYMGERFKDGARCKIGDYIMVMPGDGPRFLFKGEHCQFMYEDNVRCRLKDPDFIKPC